MYKVYVADYLSPPATIEQERLKGLATVECLLAESEEELIGRIDDADGIIVFHNVSITDQVIAVLKHCKVIARTGVGVDNVDMAAAGRNGIRVTNVPDYGIDEVADHAVALMLACNRGLIRVERQLRHTLEPWDYRVSRPVCRSSGMTLGIVGLGRIGSAVALRVKAMKMRVLACDPYLRPGMEKSLGVELVDLNTLLSESDVVSLHVPLTQETRHMIDADALARMKPQSMLVNTARGAVVDTDALAEFLKTRRIAGAGIDVLPVEPPDVNQPLIRLWREEHDPPINLLITPHTAWYSESSQEEMRIKVADEVARVLRGEKPRSCVNMEYFE